MGKVEMPRLRSGGYIWREREKETREKVDRLSLGREGAEEEEEGREKDTIPQHINKR